MPYKIHTILTDNGIQFFYVKNVTCTPRYTPFSRSPICSLMTHMFRMRLRENGIEHRFTKINHP